MNSWIGLRVGLGVGGDGYLIQRQVGVTYPGLDNISHTIRERSS